jgi:hypothetical protein
MAKRTSTTDAPEIVVDPTVASGPTGMTVPPTGGAVMEYDASDLDLGFEDTTQADIKVPLVSVVQSNSPQATPGHPKAVKGATAGQFINSLTNRLYDGRTGLSGVIVARKRQFFEAIPRTKGGGIVGRHAQDSPLIRSLQKQHGGFGKMPLPNGNEIFESVSVYVVLDHGNGQYENVVIPFASTNLGEYAKWYTLLREQKVPVGDTGQTASLPLFAHRVRFTTTFKQNKQGQWQGIVIQPDGPATDDLSADIRAARLPQDSALYREAKALNALFGAGKVQVDEGAESDVAAHDGVQDL